MAKNYVRPVLRMEEFVSNEFVSNCYTINCNLSGWFEDKDGDGRYDEGESVPNGADGQKIVHADSMPQMTTSDLYQGMNPPSTFLGWLAYILRYLVYRGESYSNRSLFTPINPGLYIVNDGGKTYGSTQQPTPVPGHPNRS